MDSKKKNEFSKRKSTRLKDFDYSSAGAYFVTICTRDRMQILSRVVELNETAVGEGLAPPEYKTQLTLCGEIAQDQLLLLEERYPSVTVEDHIIMPDHIHAIIFLHEKTGGASPSPTLDDVVCTFKSLTSRFCKQRCGIEQIFQRSYADHIVRDKDDYETRKKYIYENPMRWYYKHLITEE